MRTTPARPRCLVLLVLVPVGACAASEPAPADPAHEEPAVAARAEAAPPVFTSQPGRIEANLERWASQFEQPDGGSSAERLKRSDEVLDGRAVTHADLTGTYVAETSPGSGERVNRPNTRTLAAIVESEGGAYYVKLVGPVTTVNRWEESYRAFLEAIR